MIHIKTLIEHNNKIYNVLLSKNIGTLFENKDKSYFTININEDYYSIQSFKYGNKIMIDLIGKDDSENYKVLVLDSFESVDSLIKYFDIRYDLENDIIMNDSIFNIIMEDNYKNGFSPILNYKSSDSLIY